ncbi:zinc finger protein CG2199 [Drosophila grimshawi]|uniref:GH16227 n=1 Tax=Drosophila grimshawi TaxID=7222 RepID=B4IXG5_DROGR|nr:zinc finger protein CG2199 [Drosophila grimshawi]EDV96402.1 GH16227 [Drosophila grimshawi]
MATKTKKEIIQCDYCNIEKDANYIYTARKQFAGCKIIDILQIVTHRTIPATLPIKLCSLCASTLHAATGAITKAEEIVSQLLALTAKKPNTETNLEAAATEKVADTNIVAPSIVQKIAKKQTDKVNKSLANGPQTAVKKDEKAKVPETVTPLAALPSPNKLSQFESLQNAVKLRPAKEVPIQTKTFIQLFGNSAIERDEEEDEDDDDDNKDDDDDKDDENDAVMQKPGIRNIAINFECKLCDFTCVYPNAMKQHMREMHGQKRPRIYNCFNCVKKFGRLISLKQHLLEHNVTEEKVEEKKPRKDLAVVTALKPKPLANVINDEGSFEPVKDLAVVTALKPKPSVNFVNDECSFKIAHTNSSTPKPASEKKQKYTCDKCHKEFETVKSVAEHMSSIHNISKVFKCVVCDAEFAHKSTVHRHFKKKHGPDAVAANGLTAQKITMRRKTMDTTENTPTKISKRRKTVAVEAISQVQEDKEETLAESLEEIFDELTEHLIEEPIQIKAPSPSKSNPKEDSQLVQSLIFPKDKATPKKQKTPKGELKELFAAESPSKRKSIEKGKEIIATPTKLQNKDHKQHTPSKKQKCKLDTDVLDSPQSTATITNGQPKKQRKRNASDKQQENLSQEDTADEEQLPSTPANQLKAEKSEIDTIDLMDEINSNVKPHKRVKLDSFNVSVSGSELSCSMCSKVVVSRKRLDSHMHKRHAAQLNCPKCKTTHTTSDEYVSHFANCNSSDGLACGIHKCDKVFLSANYLSAHLKKKHKAN